MTMTTEGSADAPDLAEVLAELTALRNQVATLQATLDAAEPPVATVDTTQVGASPDHATSDVAAPSEPINVTSRRRLFALAGGAAAAAVVASTAVGNATPAAASTNDPLLLDARKVVSAGTYLGTELDYGAASVTPGTNFFTVADGSIDESSFSQYPAAIAGYGYSLVSTGLYGYSNNGGTNSRGVIGLSDSAGGTGVTGTNFTPGGRGVFGYNDGPLGIGVSGNANHNSTGAVGVLGNSTGGTGVRGTTTTGIAVTGDSASGFAVRANSATGVSLLVDGGGRARFTAATTTGPPTTGTATLGEVVRDGVGDFFVSTSAGTPGTWRKLGGPSTAGSLHAITPTRVYDSRFPGGGTLTSGNERVVSIANGIDLDNGSVNAMNLVPAGTTAIAYNFTITQATAGGFLAVTPGDASEFSASTINWTPGITDLANGTLVKVAADRTVKVWAGGGGTTHFVIDILGYYL